MERLYEFFLFRYRHQDYIEFSQARLTLNFCLITAFFSLLYVFIANFIDFHESVLVMSTLIVLFTSLAFLIRFGTPLIIITHLFLIFSFIASIILVSYSGMIYSSILPWLSFIPLIAILLEGKKAAYFWLIICFLAVFVIAFLQTDSTNISKHYNKDFEVWFYAGVYNGLTGIILTLSMLFQKAKDKVLRALEEKNQLISSINIELKSKNDEIIAQNEELVQQKEEISAQREFIEIKNRELLVVQDELNGLIDKLTITQNKLASREAENRSILYSMYSTELIVGELDLEGRFMKISSATAKLLQMNEKEVIGKSFNEIGERLHMKIENGISYEKMWNSILNGNNSNHEAKLTIGKNEFWLKENYFPILDEDGNPIKVMIVAQDISQIKNQQNEIEVLNSELQENIWKIEKQNSQLVEQQNEIESIFKKLQKSNAEVKLINQNLEKWVKERTEDLQLQNKQLKEYAYINAHLLRGPLCSILGLVQLMEHDGLQDNDTLVFHMKKSSQELQKVVEKITRALEKGTYFDRNLIHKN